MASPLWSALTSNARQSKKVKKGEVSEGSTYYGPRVREGEVVFGVAHIYASFNDTFVVRTRCAQIVARKHIARAI